MHFIAGNPYAPDSVSDWSNFAVNALIGVATAVTLIVTVIQARQASRDALSARKDAARTSAREDARERLAREDDLRRRAARQALSVWVSAVWHDDERVQPWLHNDSDSKIRDVEIRWDETGAGSAAWNGGTLQQFGSVYVEPRREPPAGSHASRPDAPFTIEFTDTFRDRWVITSDRRIRLLDSPKFVLPDEG